MLKLKVLVLFFVMAEVSCGLFRFDSSKLSSSNYASINISSINLPGGDVLINSTLVFFQNVLKETQILSVKAKRNDKDYRYEITLLETKVDSCRVEKGVLNSIFMKVLMENFDNSSDYSVKCPFPKGTLKIVNQRITSKYIPPFPKILFPSGRISFYIKTIINGKIAGEKKFVRLYSYELYGNYYEDLEAMKKFQP